MRHDEQVYLSLIDKGNLHLSSGNYSEAVMEYNYATAYETIYANTKYYHHFSENASGKIAKVEKVKYNGHKYVDLGLPSGLKWATSNIGASKEEDSGNYYAWGELYPKTTYNESTTTNYDKLMNDISSDPMYDAARLTWGGTWRMPTAEEFTELFEFCTCTWVTQDGKKGCIFKGPNGNTIFLPLAGHYTDDGLSSTGENGYYWTSTPYPNEGWNGNNYSYDAKLFGDREDLFVYFSSRIFGSPIRPVSE